MVAITVFSMSAAQSLVDITTSAAAAPAVTWKTFNEKNGLYSIQIPSNWYAEKVAEEDKGAPIDNIFRYTKGDSWAYFDIMFDNDPLYTNGQDAIDADIASLSGQKNFKVIQPTECEKYNLGGLKACSSVYTYLMDDDNSPRTILDVVAFDPNGIMYSMAFVTSNDIWDKFLPVGEYMSSTLKVNDNKLKSMLNVIPKSTSTSNSTDIDNILTNDLPTIPTNSLDNSSNNFSPITNNSKTENTTTNMIIPENQNASFQHDIFNSNETENLTSSSITIPSGASTKNHISFEPDMLTVTEDSIITIFNNDISPHTVTSGKDPKDVTRGKSFDSGIIMPGQTAKINLSNINTGNYSFYCTIHPFMNGTIQIVNQGYVNNNLPSIDNVTNSTLVVSTENFYGNYQALELNNHGVDLMKVGNYDEAISDFDKALKIEPGVPLLYVNKGIALDSKGERQQAIENFDKALNIDSKYWNALGQKGFVYMELRQYDKAIQYLDEALDVNPNSVTDLNNKGYILYLQGHLDQALATINKALEIEPNNIPTLKNKLLILMESNDFDQSLGIMNKILEIDPTDPDMLDIKNYLNNTKGDNNTYA